MFEMKSLKFTGFAIIMTSVLLLLLMPFKGYAVSNGQHSVSNNDLGKLESQNAVKTKRLSKRGYRAIKATNVYSESSIDDLKLAAIYTPTARQLQKRPKKRSHTLNLENVKKRSARQIRRSNQKGSARKAQVAENRTRLNEHKNDHLAGSFALQANRPRAYHQ